MASKYTLKNGLFLKVAVPVLQLAVEQHEYLLRYKKSIVVSVGHVDVVVKHS